MSTVSFKGSPAPRRRRISRRGENSPDSGLLPALLTSEGLLIWDACMVFSLDQVYLFPASFSAPRPVTGACEREGGGGGSVLHEKRGNPNLLKEP